LHAGPDPDPFGAGRDRGTKDQRAGGEGAPFVEMQFRESRPYSSLASTMSNPAAKHSAWLRPGSTGNS